MKITDIKCYVTESVAQAPRYRWRDGHLPDGPGVKPGISLEGASILDLTPTILHVMGVPVPQDLDGRVLSEAFDPSSPVAAPVVSASPAR